MCICILVRVPRTKAVTCSICFLVCLIRILHCQGKVASASKGKKKGKRGGKRVRNMVFASGFFSWNQLVRSLFFIFILMFYVGRVHTA